MKNYTKSLVLRCCFSLSRFILSNFLIRHNIHKFFSRCLTLQQNATTLTLNCLVFAVIIILKIINFLQQKQKKSENQK